MPNFEYTKVDPDRLSVTAGNIDESVKSLEKAFNTIDNTLGSLGESWKGPASLQFFKQYELDKSTFGSYMQEICTLNDRLRGAAGIYDGADAKAHELVGKLKV